MLQTVLELPIGWALHEIDNDVGSDVLRPFYNCGLTGESRWERPSVYGPEGTPGVWRWKATPDTPW